MKSRLSPSTLALLDYALAADPGLLSRNMPSPKEKSSRTLADINDRQAKNAAKRARRAARAKK